MKNLALIMVVLVVLLGTATPSVFATDSRDAAGAAYDQALILQKRAEENQTNAGIVGRGIPGLFRVLVAIYHQNEAVIRQNEAVIRLNEKNLKLNEEIVRLLKENNNLKENNKKR